VIRTIALNTFFLASRTPLLVRLFSLFLFLLGLEALVEYFARSWARTSPTTKNSMVSARDSTSSLVGIMDNVLLASRASSFRL